MEGQKIMLVHVSYLSKIGINVTSLNVQDNSGTIDFREYLVGYCQYSKPANTEDTLKWAFKLFDRGGKGRILLDDLIKALRASLDMTPEETTRIFKQADQNNKGYITYGKMYSENLLNL